MTAGTPPAHVAPAAQGLPAACSVLTPAAVSRALGRDVHALSAALLGESDAMRTAHLANCVYSYDRAPYPVALTVNLTLPTGDRPEALTTFQVDNRGGGIVTVRAHRFDIALWTPDSADRAPLEQLARAALSGRHPDPPRAPARRPARSGERYACEMLSPAVVAGITGTPVGASSTSAGECQYAALVAPYRVVANLTIEPKPPGTAFARERIDELRAASNIDVRSVPKLPYGHFIRPMRGPGALLLFDAGALLVTVTTLDSADRAQLERLADAVAAAASTPNGSQSSPSR